MYILNGQIDSEKLTNFHWITDIIINTQGFININPDKLLLAF